MNTLLIIYTILSSIAEKITPEILLNKYYIYSSIALSIYRDIRYTKKLILDIALKTQKIAITMLVFIIIAFPEKEVEEAIDEIVKENEK
jgi:hypothetical protein